MIPVKLNLSNFTSYGENTPELDFTKFKLAAISGLNGAGKSSLLDAITWCVWGSSRAGDSSDDLVRLGQTEMQVEFIFELDNHLYTVKRRRSKKGGGSTSLELWSNSHNLTEGTIKATQQKIIQTLHLSYETFTNSAFLRQGHADEFTTRGPTDRKRILADILGLDHYDKLEEKAKEKSKEAQTKLTLLDYQLLEIEAELSQKDEREKNLSVIKIEGENTQKEIKKEELEIKEIEEQKQFLHTKVKSLEEQKEKYSSLKNELTDLKIQLQLKEEAQKEFKSILEKKDEILENYKKIEKLDEEKQDLEKKRSQLLKIKDELSDIQKLLLERENKRKDAINTLELEAKALQTEVEQANIQINKLKSQKNICPTCGGSISQKEAKIIIEKNQKIIIENNKKLKDIDEKVKKYQTIVLPEQQKVDILQKEIALLEKKTQNYQIILEELNKLEAYKSFYLKLTQSEATLKAQTEAISDLQKIYKAKQLELEKSSNYANDLETYSKKLLETEEILINKNNKKLDLTEKLMELRSKYGQAITLVSRVTQMEQLFKQKTNEKSSLTKDKEVFEELSLAFGKKGIQAMIIEGAIPEIEDEANRLLDKLTEGRMKISLETQKETKTKVLTIDGTKERSLVETLDIIISDEMGERSYELYSGGEAFRVNIAIRLAISKLLSNRAGARLQFLVIDEGFGTQDAQGRTRLIEILDAIKDDFEKIVIITHLEELKEEFPVRIEVQKGPTGSTFEVVGI